MLDIASAVGAMDSVSLAAVAFMVFAGLVVGIPPGSYPLAAVAVGFAAVNGAQSKKAMRSTALGLSLGYVLGIVAVDAVLGALFGLVGFMVQGALVAVMLYAYFGLSALLVIAGLVNWSQEIGQGAKVYSTG